MIERKVSVRYVSPVVAVVFAIGVFLHQDGIAAYDESSTLRRESSANEAANNNGEVLGDLQKEAICSRHDGKKESCKETTYDITGEETAGIRDESESKTASQYSIPGHLKKLGEHGSPISLGEIEELDYVLNGKDFYDHFLRRRQPLVMRGVALRWPAVKQWANETYMREKYGHVVFDVEFTKHYENKHPVKKTMNMSEFLNIYKTKTVYLDCPFPQSDLTEDIMIPYCLQCDEVMSTIQSIHLLYSSGNTSSSIHQDGYENLLSVISGTKVVLVADRIYTEFFYANNYTTAPGLAPINPESVDLVRFPNIAEVPFHKVVLNAGDILYIPQHWWHHVRSFDCPNIAISLWFHVFPEKDDESISEEEMSDPNLFDDVIYMNKLFDKQVNTYPETIECRSQNKPITEAFQLPSDAWDTPKEVDIKDNFLTLSSGYNMPKLGFGTAGLFGDTKSTVLAALKVGYRLIDSAQAYDEEQVGEAMTESGIPREDVFIVSKVHPRFLGYDETVRSVEESLAKLKVEYIDLMLIHSMDCDEGPGAHLVCQKGEPKGTWEDSWQALEFLVKTGKIRSIGVSNFEIPDLQRLLKISTISPSVLQNYFDPFNQDRKTREFCERHNIKFMGHSSLGDSWLREGFHTNPVLSDDGLRKIAAKFDASIPQVVLKWSLENNVVVIPRSRKPNHIETNFQLSHVKLGDQDRQYIANLDGKIILPDNGLPYDVRSEPSTSDEVSTQEKPEESSESEVKGNINDKVVLKEKVDLEESTLYLSSDDHWIYAFDSASGKLKWKIGTADEGGSKCAFSSSGAVVYCGTDDKSIRALNAMDGSLIWKFSTNGAVTSSTRVSNDGTLYVGCLDGFFYAINPDGSLKWKKNLGEEIWSSPALLDGGKAIFVGTMAEQSANVFSLDGQTGDILWKYETGGPVFSSPAVSHDGKAVFFCSFDAQCYAFSTSSGQQLWVLEGDSSFQSSPAVSKLDGILYVGSSGGNIYAVDSATGKIKWIKEGKGELMSSPFIGPDGNVYIGSGEGEVLAVKQTDGSVVWSFKTDSSIWSSPRLDINGLLFIGGIDTYLYALRTDSGQLVWKYKTDGPVVGTPLITRKYELQQA